MSFSIIASTRRCGAVLRPGPGRTMIGALWGCSSGGSLTAPARHRRPARAMFLFYLVGLAIWSPPRHDSSPHRGGRSSNTDMTIRLERIPAPVRRCLRRVPDGRRRQGANQAVALRDREAVCRWSHASARTCSATRHSPDCAAIASTSRTCTATEGGIRRCADLVGEHGENSIAVASGATAGSVAPMWQGPRSSLQALACCCCNWRCRWQACRPPRGSVGDLVPASFSIQRRRASCRMHFYDRSRYHA